MLNMTSGVISNYGAKTECGTRADDILISQAGPQLFKSNASDIKFEYSINSAIGEKNKKAVYSLLKTSLSLLLTMSPSDMPNLFSLKNKKLKLKNNKTTICVGNLEKDVKKYFNVDANKFKPNPSAHIDGLMLGRKTSNNELETIIFIDYSVFTKEDNIARLLVILNHELGGHLPKYLDDKVSKNNNLNEFLAYNNSNKRLAKIIETFQAAEGTPPEFIEHLKKLLNNEIHNEKMYKSRIKPAGQK